MHMTYFLEELIIGEQYGYLPRLGRGLEVFNSV